MGLVSKKDKWRLSDSLWNEIEPLLPPRKPHPLECHNPRVPDKNAMEAILFVLRTGCQWNSLDTTGICSCSSAYRRFREWLAADVFKKFWDQELIKYDELRGIEWSFCSMDGAITKAPLGGELTGPNPTDRAKSGTKRSFLTDEHGIPLSIVVAGANRHDMKLTCSTLEGVEVKRPNPTNEHPQGLCLDKGYDYNEVRALAKEFGFTAHIIPRGKEAQMIKKQVGYKARRWVIERSHSWLNRFRRILIRWEKRADTFLAMLHLACGIITWRFL